MWLRSGYVTDSWELPPRSATHFYGAAKAPGWVTHRHVESAAGRVVWVSYDYFEFNLAPWVFYQVADKALVPGQRGRNDWEFRTEFAQGVVHGRIPYVAEWFTYHGRRYVAVPWPVLILSFAVLPIVNWVCKRRRVRRPQAGAAFPLNVARDRGEHVGSAPSSRQAAVS